MLPGGRTVYWPEGATNWIIWAAVIAGIFLTIRASSGLAPAILASGIGFAGYAFDQHFYIPVAVLLVGAGSLAARRIGHAPVPARRIVREGILIGAGFLAYEFGRAWAEGSLTEAQRNASRIVEFERGIGLFVEGALQRWILPHDLLVDGFNRVYSYLYLPFIIAVLLWVLLTNDEAFRMLRTSLGVSALVAVGIMAAFPVAPPRLMPDLGILDTHVMTGEEHGFVNQFAAVPSFHVGWTALAGYALYRSLPPRWWRVLAYLPSAVIALTVMVTGNHYWVDGVIGVAVALTPALLIAHLRVDGFPTHRSRRAQAKEAAAWALAGSNGERFSVTALGALLGWMLVNQVLNPGFTDYWGYMVVQVAAFIAIVVWLNRRFAAEGGFTWLTHLLVVGMAYLDVLGTAGHMYENYAVYDKVSHYGGSAALAATGYDILRAMSQRGTLSWSPLRRMLVAAAAGLALAACWEVYEFGADLIFATYRHAGALDTIYDLISDATGAIVTSVILWRHELLQAAAPRPAPVPQEPSVVSAD